MTGPVHRAWQRRICGVHVAVDWRRWGSGGYRLEALIGSHAKGDPTAPGKGHSLSLVALRIGADRPLVTVQYVAPDRPVFTLWPPREFGRSKRI